jgi:hypothetical protein
MKALLLQHLLLLSKKALLLLLLLQLQLQILMTLFTILFIGSFEHRRKRGRILNLPFIVIASI